MPFAEDLLTFLDEFPKTPVIGVGHSIGATITLLAAMQKPERFRTLVLYDPVLFPPRIGRFWKIAAWAGLNTRLHPLAKQARRRRRIYPNREAIFESYRRKPVFRYITDENLRIVIKSITKINGDGHAVLNYPPEWEARIYATSMLKDAFIWKRLHHFRIPTLILYSSNSNAFWLESAKLVRRRAPAITLASYSESTHLLPLEQPERIARDTNKFLDTGSLSGDN